MLLMLQALLVLMRSHCNMCGHAQIRTEVLKMLQALPIDLTDEQRKSQMKKSQLGHVVMFLSKPEVEDNRPNRRIARVGLTCCQTAVINFAPHRRQRHSEGSRGT